ncbi:MAG: M20/M25/M40 family metallo-hydrolase [Thermodesulfobacteriota bacterium]
MSSPLDPAALALELIALDSDNPPGREAECAAMAGGMLEAGGYAVQYHEFGPHRTGLVACLGEPAGALVLSGHLDTVPLGQAPWSVNPRGERRDGRIWGRGASDMKGGVAALLAAALAAARDYAGTGGLLLVLTAGEETGCIGASTMVRDGALPHRAGAVLVAEPTANRPMLGHKGSMWLAARFRGRAAHGSMPELGDNAVLKAARAALDLAAWAAGLPVPASGQRPTLNVGALHGGSKVNMVPDSATLELDVRFPADVDPDALAAELRRAAGPEAEFELLGKGHGVATPPDHPWVARALELLAAETGRAAEPGMLPYFTDAGILCPALGRPPVLILGPGEPGQAHQTDEWCSEPAILQAARFYEALCRDWLAAGR